ncbi:S-locus lectin protein kinase family protein [Perilla frutescens var. hirtella]|nr:S-locus lectin protein kinase family protein [Perilla frutescens var. hirtella]
MIETCVWSQPRKQCQVYDYCGRVGSCQDTMPFCSCLEGFQIKNESDCHLTDCSGGCVREMSLQCENNSSSSNRKWIGFIPSPMLFASSPVFSASENSKKGMIGVVVVSVGGVVVLLAVVMGLIWRKEKRAVGSSKTVKGCLVAFVYKDLQNATKNFSDKLGVGGFGSVFKGTLLDSTVIDVKKHDSITQGEKQFRTEVSKIGTIVSLVA